MATEIPGGGKVSQTLLLSGRLEPGAQEGRASFPPTPSSWGSYKDIPFLRAYYKNTSCPLARLYFAYFVSPSSDSSKT